MGLENIGGWELVCILLLAFFIFGPDRLPKMIAEGVRMLRQLRQMARNATGDLSRELGQDIQLDDLNPRTFVRKHLLSEADEAALRKPLTDLRAQARETAALLDPKSPVPVPGPGVSGTGRPGSAGTRREAFDSDAT